MLPNYHWLLASTLVTIFAFDWYSYLVLPREYVYTIVNLRQCAAHMSPSWITWLFLRYITFLCVLTAKSKIVSRHKDQSNSRNKRDSHKHKSLFSFTKSSRSLLFLRARGQLTRDLGYFVSPLINHHVSPNKLNNLRHFAKGTETNSFSQLICVTNSFTREARYFLTILSVLAMKQCTHVCVCVWLLISNIIDCNCLCAQLSFPPIIKNCNYHYLYYHRL